MYSDSNKKINIAIDGYSSCGKSTLARALAKKLHYIFIDTGAMYRAVTLYCMQHDLVNRDEIHTEKIIEAIKHIEIHFELNKETKKPEIFLNERNVDAEIRNLEVSSNVSKVAAIREVRKKLVLIQQKMGRKGGVVMDGRDIGSVVFPDAEVKFFVTADPLVRAKRRHLELNDPSISMEDVLKNLEERDLMDTTRKESPLIQVPDAIVIDNSELNQEEQLDFALEKVKEILINC